MRFARGVFSTERSPSMNKRSIILGLICAVSAPLLLPLDASARPHPGMDCAEMQPPAEAGGAPPPPGAAEHRMHKPPFLRGVRLTDAQRDQIREIWQGPARPVLPAHPDRARGSQGVARPGSRAAVRHRARQGDCRRQCPGDGRACGDARRDPAQDPRVAHARSAPHRG